MSKILFKINGTQYEVDGNYGPDFTLNEFIRTVAGLRGTKAMCHEGGCGACVVAVQAPAQPNNELKMFSVNSCLVSVLSCHNWEVTTVEGIGNRTIGYHDIQTRLAKFNGTQCGYCTPGWVMNMYSLYKSKNGNLSAAEIENSFASNICRCTGYRSIADAFKTFARDADEDIIKKLIDVEDICKLKACGSKCTKICSYRNSQKPNPNKIQFDEDTKKDSWCILGNMQNEPLMVKNTGGDTFRWFKVYKLSDLFKVIEQNDDYKIVAGNTGQGVYHVKKYPTHIIDISDVVELKAFLLDVNLILGAGMTLSDMMELFLKMSSENENFSYLKEFYSHMDLVAHIPVKNIMPRSQNAHAIVNAGFLFNIDPNTRTIKEASIVYGGISPEFIHAHRTEVTLVGNDIFTDEILQRALTTLSEELNPVDAPPEPSAAFRKILAIALFYKAVLNLCPENKINPTFKSGGETLKRISSQGSQVFDTDKSLWPLNQPIPKLEALNQCSGEATFANDFPKQVGEVFAAFVTADVNPGSVINYFDTTEAFKIPGVIKFYTAKDIPGVNSFTPFYVPLLSEDEEILCSKVVKFYGQPVGIIVADREKTANKAAELVKVNYTINQNKPLLTIDDVLKSDEKNKRIVIDKVIEPTEKGDDVKAVLYGEFNYQTQYHYYMEPQTCVVTPTEDGLEVYAATQWLDVTGISVAQCLNIPVNSVNVIVRRVGGSYGGKITRSGQIACGAALVTHLLGKTCRLIMSLETNMKMIGKRTPTYSKFEVGINDEGEIQYLRNVFYQNNGASWNEKMTYIVFKHFYNCYDYKRWYVEANGFISDLPSNTWCRAPGSTEGIAMIEEIMERISHHTGKDPVQVRLTNMTKENNPIPELIEQIKHDSDYDNRVNEIANFNKVNRWRKRAIKLMPMTYEIFYVGPYSASVSVYHADGSVIIFHGGIEMGQGINTKVAQVCAYILKIPLEKVSVKTSSTFTSPNSMTTAGSIGSECVAFAVIKACETILERLKPFKDKNENATWNEIVKEAFLAGVHLQASHMYDTTDTTLKPYAIYGVVVLEVELDLLTGNHDIRRVDLLEDTGRSLSPEIDIGQIEGAFIMGLGYWTSENIIYDPKNGKILTDRTWTYKPPGLKDIPADFRIYFQRNSKNEVGVLQSKATGEPALCLAAVITHALRETIRLGRLDAGYDDHWVELGHPCSVENIFMAMEHKLEHFKLTYLPQSVNYKKMQLPKHMKIAAGSLGAAIFGVLFGWVIFPIVLKSQLKKEMALSPKTDVRKMWQKIPFPLDFKIYLFNYTNAEEVQKGAIPIVKEIGPYYFEEWKEKVEVEDHDDSDTITYKRLDSFYFKKELSGPGLTGEELVVLPHPFMMATIGVVIRDKPAMLNMIGKAFNGIFENPPDIFIRAKALDLLFRGIVINCARTEFAPKALCTALKKEAANTLIFGPNNQYVFSLFGMRNGTTDSHVVTVMRGMNNVMDVGKVIAIDGKPKMEMFRDQCNEYEGTDGTVFPPFLTQSDRLESFSGDLCRSFKPWFQKPSSYSGIKTNRYIANIGDYANDPELQCYCDSPDTCPAKGLMDLMKCMGAPMYVSLPHFLDCDPKIREAVKGLNPDVNEHEISIDFEPITGTPLVARQRVQFNIKLVKTEKMELCKDLPDTIVPLFWIEEGLALNKTFTNMLKHQLFIPKRVVGVLRWLLVSSGLLTAMACLLFHYKDKIMHFAVSNGSDSAAKIRPEETEQREISVIGETREPPKVEM
ncbi:Sensory neuron membrane protein 1 [Papilio xuthus]|uniref:Sensory neuron membrane protein 1 n=1 Tax=Papilio xuthus TaxID=66420 RepID=A0A194PDZ5_PAPXU|nr:Sensory neuron membrane protein 1 [Papilio xuthus]